MSIFVTICVCLLCVRACTRAHLLKMGNNAHFQQRTKTHQLHLPPKSIVDILYPFWVVDFNIFFNSFFCSGAATASGPPPAGDLGFLTSALANVPRSAKFLERDAINHLLGALAKILRY